MERDLTPGGIVLPALALVGPGDEGVYPPPNKKKFKKKEKKKIRRENYSGVALEN